MFNELKHALVISKWFKIEKWEIYKTYCYYGYVHSTFEGNFEIAICHCGDVSIMDNSKSIYKFGRVSSYVIRHSFKKHILNKAVIRG